MDCSEVRDLLSSFNDREATVEERAAVEDHLRSCRECAFESTMIVGLKRLLGHWDGVRASQKFRAELMEKVTQQPKPGPLSRVNWRPVWIGAAAACGAVVVAAVLWLVIPAPRSGAVAPPTVAGSPEGSDITMPVARGAGGASEPVAQVRVQEGTLRIRRADGPESLGSAGDVLAPGDSVKVAGRGEVELAFVGGLRLRLFSGRVSGTAGGAEFVIGRDPSEGELRSGTSLLVGAADVRAGDAYSVKTAPALVSFEKRDLLAEMALEADGSLALALARGRAEVMLPEGVQELGSGEALGVAPDGKLSSPPGPAAPETLERLWRWGKR